MAILKNIFIVCVLWFFPFMASAQREKEFFEEDFDLNYIKHDVMYKDVTGNYYPIPYSNFLAEPNVTEIEKRIFTGKKMTMLDRYIYDGGFLVGQEKFTYGCGIKNNELCDYLKNTYIWSSPYTIKLIQIRAHHSSVYRWDTVKLETTFFYSVDSTLKEADYVGYKMLYSYDSLGRVVTIEDSSTDHGRKQRFSCRYLGLNFKTFKNKIREEIDSSIPKSDGGIVEKGLYMIENTFPHYLFEMADSLGLVLSVQIAYNDTSLCYYKNYINVRDQKEFRSFGYHMQNDKAVGTSFQSNFRPTFGGGYVWMNTLAKWTTDKIKLEQAINGKNQQVFKIRRDTRDQLYFKDKLTAYKITYKYK